MGDPTVLAAVGLSAAGIVGAAVALAGGQPTRRTEVWRIPPNLTAAQVEAMLGVIAGQASRVPITFSVRATADAMEFTVTGSGSALRLLSGALGGIAPEVRIDVAPESNDETPSGSRSVVRWVGEHVLLRTDGPELASAALLGALRGLYRGERIELRTHLQAAGRVPPPAHPRADAQTDVLARWLLREGPPSPDLVRALRAKYAEPLLRVAIEVVVTRAAPARASMLLQQVEAVLRSRCGARGRLVVRRKDGQGRTPRPNAVVSAREAVGLLGLPIDGPSIPGLEYSRAPRLMPSVRIPSGGAGRRFAFSTWPGMEKRGLVQPVAGSLSHALIIGPTGSGKSALVTNLLVQDVTAGRGALLLDMKGDTAHDLLERIPESRKGDVVVLDPSTELPLPSVKGLGGGDPELTADLWLGIFRNLFADSWGVRTERYLRLGLLTITRDPRATIIDLPRAFSDRAYRKRCLARADDPLLMAAWVRFDALSPAQAAEHVSAPLGKVQDVISRKVVRGVVGQRSPRLTIREAIRRQKLVVVRLRPGTIGEPAARLLGALVVYETYQAVLERQGWPPEGRRPYGFYVDEPAVLSSLPIPLDDLFELARGLGVGVTLAAQSIVQLPQRLQRAALTNAATIATFRAGADDAKLIARELQGVTAEQVQHLERFEIALRLGLDHGNQAPVATGTTVPLPDPISDALEIARLSGARYGRSMAEVDADLRRQHETATSTEADAAPVGRRRRTS